MRTHVSALTCLHSRSGLNSVEAALVRMVLGKQVATGLRVAACASIKPTGCAPQGDCG